MSPFDRSRPTVLDTTLETIRPNTDKEFTEGATIAISKPGDQMYDEPPEIDERLQKDIVDVFSGFADDEITDVVGKVLNDEDIIEAPPTAAEVPLATLATGSERVEQFDAAILLDIRAAKAGAGAGAAAAGAAAAGEAAAAGAATVNGAGAGAAAAAAATNNMQTNSWISRIISSASNALLSPTGKAIPTGNSATSAAVPAANVAATSTDDTYIEPSSAALETAKPAQKVVVATLAITEKLGANIKEKKSPATSTEDMDIEPSSAAVDVTTLAIETTDTEIPTGNSKTSCAVPAAPATATNNTRTELFTSLAKTKKLATFLQNPQDSSLRVQMKQQCIIEWLEERFDEFSEDYQKLIDFPYLEWEGNSNKEEGGIGNAPYDEYELSICYFSSAIQLLFRGIGDTFKKKIPVYDDYITINEARNYWKIAQIVERLHKGENIEFDINYSPKLAMEATIDVIGHAQKVEPKINAEGIVEYVSVLDGQENFKSAHDSVHWIYMRFLREEVELKGLKYNVNTKEKTEDIIAHFMAYTETGTLSVQQWILAEKAEQEKTFSKAAGGQEVRYDYCASQKFVVETTKGPDGFLVTDALHVSWDNYYYKAGKQFGVLRGFILFAGYHYTTFVRSFKDAQNRWICYDDDEVKLDANEALFLLPGAKVLLYDSCNEEEYRNFVHSEVGTVKIFEKMLSETAAALAFVTIILREYSTEEEVDKLEKVTNYITKLFGPSFLYLWDSETVEILMKGIRHHLNSVPKIAEEMEETITSSFTATYQNLKKKTKTNFVAAVKKTEKTLVNTFLPKPQVMHCSKLQKIITEDIAKNIWEKVKTK